MLTQLLYVIGNWQLHRSKDYLRYGLYISLLICYIGTIFAYDLFSGSPIQNTIGLCADIIKRPLGIILFMVYFRFINLFLQLRKNVPVLNSKTNAYVRQLVVILVLQVLMVVFGVAYTAVGNAIYFLASLYIFSYLGWFFIEAFRNPVTKQEILLKGSTLLAVGAFLTIVFSAYGELTGRTPKVLPDFLPFFSGILLELLFFNLAIARKVTRQEEETSATQKLVITQLSRNEQLITERQQIRNKIARDLHDELGSTLSGVVLFGELCLRSIYRGNPLEADAYLNRINNECRAVSEKMNDIVWATQQDHDTAEKLLHRLKCYAAPLCASDKTTLHFLVDEKIKQTYLEPEKRKHIYLFSKEALNNAVKYAKAGSIWYTASIQNDICCIVIKDDGCGFDTATSYEGNGLKNMHARSVEIGGKYHIQSGTGMGTCITFQFPAHD